MYYIAYSKNKKLVGYLIQKKNDIPSRIFFPL